MQVQVAKKARGIQSLELELQRGMSSLTRVPGSEFRSSAKAIFLLTADSSFQILLLTFRDSVSMNAELTD